MREEKDLIGTKELDEDAYYGINTARAQENFNLTNRNVNEHLIEAIVEIKKAAAAVNYEVDRLEEDKKEAIVQACEEILAGSLRDEFQLDALQGGAGTSTNMMVNEVVANRAIEILGGTKGDYEVVHPNQDVNLGQSTNDVYPTALKLASLRLLIPLTEEVAELQEAF